MMSTVPRPDAIVHDVAMFLLHPPQPEAAAGGMGARPRHDRAARQRAVRRRPGAGSRNGNFEPAKGERGETVPQADEGLE